MSTSDSSVADLIEACRRGECAIGLDLGHGKNLILDTPPDAWEQRWGARPPAYWRPIVAVLLSSPALIYLAGIVGAFLLWRWYWALLMIPGALLGFAFPTFSGYPHPWRYLLVAGLLWVVSFSHRHSYIPPAVFATAMMVSNTMYYLTGVWLRRYALNHPKAFEEWISKGFVSVRR